MSRKPFICTKCKESFTRWAGEFDVPACPACKDSEWIERGKCADI